MARVAHRARGTGGCTGSRLGGGTEHVSGIRMTPQGSSAPKTSSLALLHPEREARTPAPLTLPSPRVSPGARGPALGRRRALFFLTSVRTSDDTRRHWASYPHGSEFGFLCPQDRWHSNHFLRTHHVKSTELRVQSTQSRNSQSPTQMTSEPG